MQACISIHLICFEDCQYEHYAVVCLHTCTISCHSLLPDYLMLAFCVYWISCYRILWSPCYHVLRTCPLCSWSAIQNNQRRIFPRELITGFALSSVHAGIGLWELRGTLCGNLCREDIINNTQSYAPACSILGPGFEKLLITLWPSVPHFPNMQEAFKHWMTFSFQKSSNICTLMKRLQKLNLQLAL